MRLPTMIRITGVGGLFFRSADKESLAGWYQRVLGISMMWQQEAGPTVFSPFRASTDYFPAEKQWMVNFRVENLDDAIAHVKAEGVAVETRPEEWDSPETGRFARIFDPEGNAIELWEPPPSE
jgi:predicted enzyme related to lactoylglutathione lyase